MGHVCYQLNVAYFNGALLFAGFIGLCFQRRIAFLLALAVGIASGVYMGDIRPKQKR